MRAGLYSKITIQTSETVILRPKQHTIVAHCPQCAADVEMMTPGMAASLLGVRLRGIYRLIEAGQLHFLETPAGLVLVCRNSLSQSNQLPAAEPGSPNKLNKES